MLSVWGVVTSLPVVRLRLSGAMTSSPVMTLRLQGIALVSFSSSRPGQTWTSIHLHIQEHAELSRNSISNLCAPRSHSYDNVSLSPPFNNWHPPFCLRSDNLIFYWYQGIQISTSPAWRHRQHAWCLHETQPRVSCALFTDIALYMLQTPTVVIYNYRLTPSAVSSSPPTSSPHPHPFPLRIEIFAFREIQI